MIGTATAADHYKCRDALEHATIRVDVTLSATSRAALIDLARRALRERLGAGALDEPFAAPPALAELLAPAGCFVSLHERGTHRLRGCVGRLDAAKPLWETVYLTTGETLRDPRFVNQPVTGVEL